MGSVCLTVVAVAICSLIGTALVGCGAEPAPVDREKAARERTLKAVQKLCKSKSVAFPPSPLVLRAFKKEAILEVWAFSAKEGRLVLLKSYPVLQASGGPGPKRREGDRQVPEGLYYVNRFNPKSRFHLSLGLNYPNASDLILSDKEKPGADIFIHGSNVSIGCLAMGDEQIEEIYTLARSAKGRIQVLMLPAKAVSTATPLDRQLKAINALFEKNGKVPTVTVDAAGNYLVGR